MKRKRPIAIDLFAGAGGLSLGFEQAGFDVVAAVEIDPIHAAIHALNFPECAVLCRDIADVKGTDLREAAQIGDDDIDAVVGGAPCQGFSLIGHRLLDDPRNRLVFHFLRLVRELAPRAFVFENVPGMATGSHSALLCELIDGFSEAGYTLRMPYRVLNAAHFGVPQDRRRLFLLGARKGQPLPPYPQPTSRIRGRADLALVDLPECPSVDEAIGDLPDIEDYECLLHTDLLRVRLEGGGTYARRLRGELQDPGDHSYQRAVEGDCVTGCLRAKHTEVSRTRFAHTSGNTTEPISRFFKLSRDGICNTLRSGTGSDRGAFSAPRPIHPVHPRCISVREAARLHSYPDWFRFHRTIWHGFRQIGNSVPPLLGRAVANSVLNALDIQVAVPARLICPGQYELAQFNMRAAAAHFGVRHDVIPPRRRQTVSVGR